MEWRDVSRAARKIALELRVRDVVKFCISAEGCGFRKGVSISLIVFEEYILDVGRIWSSTWEEISNKRVYVSDHN